MNLTQLKQEISFEEGLRFKPYKCTAGKLTIGYGRNLEDVGITKEEAEILLDNDIRRVVEALDKRIPWWVDLSQNRQRALVNMAFQLGVDGLMQFKKMIAALERKDYVTACREALDSKWAKVDTPQRAHRISKMILEG